MGSTDPRFYYYPDPSGTREEIDLAELVSDIQRLPPANKTIRHTTYAGGHHTADFGSQQRYRLVWERFADGEVRRQLENLERHLYRGGLCGFALNHTKGWAAFVDGLRPPQRGDATVSCPAGQAFYNLTPSLSSGDEIVIQSGPPESNYEIHTVSAATSTLLTLSGSTVTYTHGGSPVLARERDFFPVLRLDASGLSAKPVTHEHRIVYTLDCVLVEDWQAITAVWASGASFMGTTFSGGRISLESALTSAGTTYRLGGFARPGQ